MALRLTPFLMMDGSAKEASSMRRSASNLQKMIFKQL